NEKPNSSSPAPAQPRVIVHAGHPVPRARPAEMPKASDAPPAPPAPAVVVAQPMEPIVIDLPSTPLPRFALPPDFHQRIEQIRKLSSDLAKLNELPKAERDLKKLELEQLNKNLQIEMQQRSDEFNKALNAALAERQNAREVRRVL